MLTQPISIIIAGSLIALSILGEGYLDRKDTQEKIDRCYSLAVGSEGIKLSEKKLSYVLEEHLGYLLMECEEKYR